MSQIHAELERPIAAPASQVYAYFADYRDHHPRLLPSAFSDNRVEQGGIGAGTVVSFKTTVAGRTQSYRVYVTEPVPGRVMVETRKAYPWLPLTQLAAAAGISRQTANKTLRRSPASS